MVTKEQAITARHFHYIGKHDCSKTVGPRGGITTRITEVRASGKCQTWKRDPLRFRLPIKYGLYESWEITQDNAADFHIESECPLDQQNQPSQEALDALKWIRNTQRLGGPNNGD